jgi:hypothetical protein
MRRRWDIELTCIAAIHVKLHSKLTKELMRQNSIVLMAHQTLANKTLKIFGNVSKKTTPNNSAYSQSDLINVSIELACLARYSSSTLLLWQFN